MSQSKENTKKEEDDKGDKYAQLRRSVRERENVPIGVAARKKVNQMEPTTTSVHIPQLPIVDTAVLPSTRLAGIYPMLYSNTVSGFNTSSRTFPGTTLCTASTILYSRVPVQRELNTVNSQDHKEHSSCNGKHVRYAFNDAFSIEDDKCRMSQSKENTKKEEDDKAQWNESLWLFKVLNNIGANDGYRKICQVEAITSEIITTLSLRLTAYRVGSFGEGTVLPGVSTDIDQLYCDEMYPVIEDISQAHIGVFCLLLVTEPETPTGFVKLQLVMSNVPCYIKHWGICTFLLLRFYEIDINRYFKTDRFERIVLFDLIHINTENVPVYFRPKNKPAVTIYGVDSVVSYRCKTWPKLAQEWLSRRRCNGGPTNKSIEELKSLGCFVVRKGNPLSSEQDLEWRISFSLQERKLIFNLTDVQYKCYVLLKMINRDIIHLDCITTYHWKTCLFYEIEENEAGIWQNNLLFQCVKMCIKRMLILVRCGVCPDYFISRENLFDGRMNACFKLLLEDKLMNLLNVGFAFLLDIQSNNICDYVRSRGDDKWLQRLQTQSIEDYKKMLFWKKVDTMQGALIAASQIFGHYEANEKQSDFIEFLWSTLNHFQHLHSIHEHTPQETGRATSKLLPFIYTCLASNISSMCIKQPNLQIRNFLLLGCYTLFLKGDLPGRLKFISVLYAIGCFKECKRYLDQLDEKFIRNNPSVCVCHINPSEMMPLNVNEEENSDLKISTCVFFLQSELPIIPDALKFEIFKYLDIKSHKKPVEGIKWRWHYRVVVDSNIYYFFLKFLINRKVKGLKLSIDNLMNMKKIADLLPGSNVRHRDVSYILLAWCSWTLGILPMALDLLNMSWHLRQQDTNFPLFPKEMKPDNYKFNSAKIQALVILYNIWGSRKQPIAGFCFQCYHFGSKTLQICTRCKKATYCSTRCQTKNLTIHEAVCEIVRHYHNV